MLFRFLSPSKLFHRYGRKIRQTISISSFSMQSYSSRIIDLRSDTVTKPCDQMRSIIAHAKVGDDVYGEDPSVLKLEETMASLCGKETALFVPSGTMSNLLAIASHCRRGDEIIAGEESHIFQYEGVGASAYLGVGIRTIKNQENGGLDLEDIKEAIRDNDIHYPRTRLIAMENTHNLKGGRVVPLNIIDQVGDLCRQYNFRFHLDGARLGNAVIASNSSFKILTQSVDSVSICLSKGLGAPVGSVLVGSDKFIFHARRARKSLGGGMRQAGVLAAAGLFALEKNLSTLSHDHIRAKTLAQELSKLPSISLDDVSTIETNIIYFTIHCKHLETNQVIHQLGQRNILLGGGYGKQNKCRIVTHLGITDECIERTIKAFQDVLGEGE